MGALPIDVDFPNYYERQKRINKLISYPESVLDYLGRYTHRVAISNSHILKVDNEMVTFRWLNRKNSYVKKEQTISRVAFQERFLEHIMPSYYRRIRHLVFFANRKKKENITIIRAQFCVKIEEFDKRTRAIKSTILGQVYEVFSRR